MTEIDTEITPHRIPQWIQSLLDVWNEDGIHDLEDDSTRERVFDAMYNFVNEVQQILYEYGQKMEEQLPELAEQFELADEEVPED